MSAVGNSYCNVSAAFESLLTYFTAVFKNNSVCIYGSIRPVSVFWKRPTCQRPQLTPHLIATYLIHRAMTRLDSTNTARIFPQTPPHPSTSTPSSHPPTPNRAPSSPQSRFFFQSARSSIGNSIDAKSTERWR